MLKTTDIESNLYCLNGSKLGFVVTKHFRGTKKSIIKKKATAWRGHLHLLLLILNVKKNFSRLRPFLCLEFVIFKLFFMVSLLSSS